MAINKKDLTNILKASFPDAEISLEDHFASGEKYELIIKSARFKGLNRVKQHQLVMQCLQEALATKLHAISIKTVING
jgi:stress-induced morphogen